MNTETVPETAETTTALADRAILRTIGDLMQAFQERQNGRSAMLRSLVGHLCRYFNRAPESIAISELVGLRPRLRTYFQERKFKPNSIKSYINFLRILLQQAVELGWRDQSSDMTPEWQEVRACISPKRGCLGIIKFALRHGRSPNDFSDEDLERWAEEQLSLGHRFEYIRGLKGCFRTYIKRGGFAHRFPHLTFDKREPYGVPLSQLPEPLRTQVLDVLSWKTARCSPGRPSKSKHRAITALGLRWVICRVFGYVKKTYGKQPSSLAELLCEEYVSGFALWCINERRLRTKSVAPWIGLLPPLGKHSLFAGKDFSWARKLIAELPPDSEDERRERKMAKWVDYDQLSAVPEEILSFA